MNFFDEGSPYLGHPLLTTERTLAELDRIEGLIGGLAAGSSVIDLGCGFGRHVLALAARGHHAVGLDPSPVMIAAAEAAGSSADSPGNATLHCGPAADAHSLVVPASIDLALCLFTTFGQVSAEHDVEASTSALLQAAFEALRPGGFLVLELPERDRAVAVLVAEEQLGPTAVTRSFDAATSTLHERFEAPAGSFDLTYQLFDRKSLQEMLVATGFEAVTVIDEALVPPPPTFMTLVARRPE